MYSAPIVAEQVGGLAVQLLGHEVGAGGRLYVVAEAGEEDHVADLVGELGRCGAGRDEGDAGLLGDWPERQHRVGIGKAHRHRHLPWLTSWLAVEAMTVGSVLVS